MVLVQNLATRRAIIDELVGAGGVYEVAIVHLFNQPFTPALDTVLADLTAIECDFPGYAPSAAIVWHPTYDNGAGQAIALGSLIQFNCTGDTIPQDVYGAFWATPDGLVGVDVFDTPLPARKAFDSIPYIPTLAYPT